MALVSLSQASVIIRWSGTDPLILGAWRLLIAGSILFIWSQKFNSHQKIRESDFRKIVAAGFTFFMHLFSYAWAAHHTSISHLMLIFSLNPVTTAMGSWIFFKEKMTLRQGASYGLALLGIFILAREKNGASEISGDIVAVVAAITFSAYALLSKWARRDLSNSVFASRMYFSGSAFFFLAAVLFKVTPPLPIAENGWMGIGLLALFPTLLGHGVFTFSMKHIPLHILSLGKLIEPAIAVVSAFLLFGETLTSSAIISFGLVIAAVALVVREKT